LTLVFVAAGVFSDAAQDVGPWACGDILFLPLYQHFATNIYWVDTLKLKNVSLSGPIASDQMFVVKEMSVSKVHFAH
jgi:hypothetical protein